jgi:predicted DNA-binding transcriptional regulator AlpA
MRDSRETPDEERLNHYRVAGGDIRNPAANRTHHTNPTEILAQRGSQRALKANLPVSIPEPFPPPPDPDSAGGGVLSGPHRHSGRNAAPMARQKVTDDATIEPKLTVDEVIAELRISRSTFYYWRQIGKAPRCLRLPNGEIRVRRIDLDEWFDGLEEAA